MTGHGAAVPAMLWRCCDCSLLLLLLLLTLVLQCPRIAAAMADLENPLMAAISKNLQHETLGTLGTLIDEYVTEETAWTKSAVAQRQQECFAVRPGVDGTLDAVRKVNGTSACTRNGAGVAASLFNIGRVCAPWSADLPRLHGGNQHPERRVPSRVGAASPEADAQHHARVPSAAPHQRDGEHLPVAAGCRCTSRAMPPAV